MSTLTMPSKRMAALGPDDPDDGDLGRQRRGLAIAALVQHQEEQNRLSGSITIRRRLLQCPNG